MRDGSCRRQDRYSDCASVCRCVSQRRYLLDTVRCHALARGGITCNDSRGPGLFHTLGCHSRGVMRVDSCWGRFHVRRSVCKSARIRNNGCITWCGAMAVVCVGGLWAVLE